MQNKAAATEPPDYLACFWLSSSGIIPLKCLRDLNLGSGLATAGVRISSPCSFYGKKHGIVGRQHLLHHNKVKHMKAACGSWAPSPISHAAWRLHSGRVGLSHTKTCTPYHQRAHCELYGVEMCSQLPSDHITLSHCCTVQFLWLRTIARQHLMFSCHNNGFFAANQPQSPD